MILRVFLIISLMFSTLNLAHAEEPYVWEPLSQEAIDRIERICSEEEQGNYDNMIKSYTAGGILFGGGILVLVVFSNSLAGPMIPSGSFLLSSASSYQFFPPDTKEFLALVDDLQNGLVTPRVDQFRMKMEEQNILYSIGLKKFNQAILEQRFCTMYAAERAINK